MFDKEHLREVFCLSKIQDIEVNKSIQPTRENPEVLSDTESDRKDEYVDVLGNTNNVQRFLHLLPNDGNYSSGQNT